MTKTEFNKEVTRILAKYNIKLKNDGYGYTETPFGEVSMKLDKTPYIKLYNLYMRFTEDFDISYFHRYFSKDEGINRFSKKWNRHTEDAEWLLDELDERLNNLKYILKRDGKVCGTQSKPFLEEIETN